MNKLTIKQRQLIAGIVSGVQKRTAAIQAGYTEQSARAIAHETLKNPEVLKSLDDIMQAHGITDNYIAQKLLELAEAETKGTPHWPARARALDMMLKVKGLYSQELPEKKAEISKIGRASCRERV